MSNQSDDPPVYQCEGGDVPIFFTLVRDCEIPEKFSRQATTRQLFVGLQKLDVIAQDPIEIGNSKLLRSLISGLLDVEPVLAVTFSQREDRCVTDLVAWRFIESVEATEPEITSFDQETKHMAEVLLQVQPSQTRG